MAITGSINLGRFLNCFGCGNIDVEPKAEAPLLSSKKKDAKEPKSFSSFVSPLIISHGTIAINMLMLTTSMIRIMLSATNPVVLISFGVITFISMNMHIYKHVKELNKRHYLEAGLIDKEEDKKAKFSYKVFQGHFGKSLTVSIIREALLDNLINVLPDTASDESRRLFALMGAKSIAKGMEEAPSAVVMGVKNKKTDKQKIRGFIGAVIGVAITILAVAAVDAFASFFLIGAAPVVAQLFIGAGILLVASLIATAVQKAFEGEVDFKKFRESSPKEKWKIIKDVFKFICKSIVMSVADTSISLGIAQVPPVQAGDYQSLADFGIGFGWRAATNWGLESFLSSGYDYLVDKMATKAKVKIADAVRDKHLEDPIRALPITGPRVAHQVEAESHVHPIADEAAIKAKIAEQYKAVKAKSRTSSVASQKSAEPLL